MSDVRPLSPFEHLLLRDQRPGYPMCFFLHCDVEGPLDPERLRRALVSAAERHPLVRSRIRDSWWRPTWRAADTDPLFVVVRADAGPAEVEAAWAPIDVRRTSGVRLVALEIGTDAWKVVLQVQHSVCDGLAGYEFLGDVWSIYHGSPPAPFRSPSRTLRRLAGPTSTEPVVAEAELVSETARFAGFVPATLARGPAAAPADTTDGPTLPYVTRILGRDATATIKDRAATIGATLNDVVVAAVMRAMIAWNESAGLPARRVRVTMPASLKPPGTRAPACIDMGYAFLDRDVRACGEIPSLVRSLAAASRWIQEHRAAGVFLDTLATLDRFPPSLRLVTRIPLTLSTAVVSNVGNVGPRMKINAARDGGADLPGGLRLRAVAGVPPVRPGTRLAVGVVLYDGSLALSFLCDPRRMSAAAPSLLADLVTAEVSASSDALAGAGGNGCRDGDGGHEGESP